MKKLWVNVVPYKKEVVTTALESGAEAVVVPDGKTEMVRQWRQMILHRRRIVNQTTAAKKYRGEFARLNLVEIQDNRPQT